MKNRFFLVLGALIITGCHNDNLFDEQAVQDKENQAIYDNAAQIFGTIDPNQDWNGVTTGSVTITADADLTDIVKVQILTESPYMNPDAQVLNEAEVSKGETVSLPYDAPNIYTRLIVACVDKEGHYFTKGFNIGEKEVSFQNDNSRRTTRRAAVETYNFPSLSNFVLPVSKSFISYNAIRAIRANEGINVNQIGIWKNSGWENDRMWRNNSSYNSKDKDYKKTYNGSDWYMQNFSIRRDLAGGISDEEKTNLEDIFNTYLFWDNESDATLHKNNLDLIRDSKMVALFNNEFEASGEPVIFTPVQATSFEMQYCDLYYYYYNPENVAGMDEAEEVQYIQNLPKFMAMSTYDAMLTIKGSAEFFKNHEYVLPYYGDNLDVTTLDDYSSDGKLYRIRNGYQVNGQDYFMVYDKQENWRLATRYADDAENLDMQLWQVFKSSDGKNCYLYNVGAKCYLYYSNKYNTSFTDADYLEGNIPAYVLIEDNGTYHFNRNNDVGLGSDLASGKNKGIWSDKTASSSGVGFNWYLDEYVPGSDCSYALKTKVERLNKSYAAQGFVIPKGYKIGFLMRKARDNHDDAFNHYFGSSFSQKRNGDIYGDGRLNKQINMFPDHFMGKYNTDIIQEDDPRIAVFSANNKMYATFEDGADANYADMIMEITNGVKIIADAQEIVEKAYSLCFEDRPNTADYDMNDVVLRCTRKDKTTLVLSLVATGANDEVYVHGAEGWPYNDQEVHAVFGLPYKERNDFVNTDGRLMKEPVSAEVTVDETLSIADYLKNIYIENRTTGNIVKVATAGEPPFGIIVPNDFEYPEERVSIVTAYPRFLNWSRDMNTDKDWYLYPEEGIYPSPFNKDNE